MSQENAANTGPHDRRPPYTTSDSKSHTLPDTEHSPTGEVDRAAPRGSILAWMQTTWALITHSILSVVIVAFIHVGMEGRPFNISDRISTVQVIGGNVTLPFVPIQSDIVTLLSCLIVVQKWAVLAWVTPLCWRIALFLMEKHGLHQTDFKALIKYRLLTPRTYLTSLPTFLIGTLLLANLTANLSTPILTGSISWIPTNRAIRGLHTDPVQFDELEAGSLKALPQDYMNSSSIRDSYIQRGVGLVGIAWGRGVDKHIRKRVTSSVEALGVGSTIERVTLPYFEAESIKWIQSETELPAYATSDPDPDATLKKAVEWTPGELSGLPFGYAALIPDLTNPTNWSSDSLNSRTIEETRLLVLSFRSDARNLTRIMPPNIYQKGYSGTFYAFAWVTFRAGVSRCKDYQCVVSAPSTIQNQVELDLEPHPLTFQALSMATVVSISLVNQNASLPFPWDNVDDYVEAILIRSYSASWNILNGRMKTSTMSSRYDPALPGLRASINHTRIYGWLGVQLFVMLLGILFFVLQAGLSEFPLIGDTAFTAFYMDTTGVPRDGIPDPFMNGVLTIQQDGDRLTVVKGT